MFRIYGKNIRITEKNAYNIGPMSQASSRKNNLYDLDPFILKSNYPVWI